MDAAGVRITPRSPDTTAAWVDIWADPHSGLPLSVEVGSRSTSSIVVSTSFLEVKETRPSRSLVSFEMPGDAYFTRADAPDLAQAIERYSPIVLPDAMGRRRWTQGFRAARIYGQGFDLIAVLALPAQYSPVTQDQLDRLKKVRGPWDSAYLATTPIVNGAIVERRGITYMLGGAVTPHALLHAARILMSRPPIVGHTCC